MFDKKGLGLGLVLGIEFREKHNVSSSKHLSVPKHFNYKWTD